MPSRIIAFVFVVLVFTSLTCCALPAVVHHPLDGLTPDEYWKAYNTLHAAGKLRGRNGTQAFPQTELIKGVAYAKVRGREGYSRHRKLDTR